MTRRRLPDRHTKFVYETPAPGIIVTPPDPHEPIPTYVFPEDDPGEQKEETPRQPILSIGTSLHSWGDFERLLRGAAIELVIDVRSSPRSRLPHFNQASLRERLRIVGMKYLFLGDALGGRPTVGDPDYEAMATSPVFAAAVERVIGIGREHRSVLMCSEHEPLACHRCLLIGRELTRRGALFANILRDGFVEAQSQTEDRLLKAIRQTKTNPRAPYDDRLAAAYRLQNQRLNRLGMRRGHALQGRGDGSKSR